MRWTSLKVVKPRVVVFMVVAWKQHLEGRMKTNVSSEIPLVIGWLLIRSGNMFEYIFVCKLNQIVLDWVIFFYFYIAVSNVRNHTDGTLQHQFLFQFIFKVLFKGQSLGINSSQWMKWWEFNFFNHGHIRDSFFLNISNKQNIFNIYFVVELRTLMKKKYHQTILKIVV